MKMNDNLEKYSQGYLHRQQNQYDLNQQQNAQQQRQASLPMEQSRHGNNKEQYDMRQLYAMLQQSQEYNENLKNIIDDLKKQLKESKHKVETSNKENETLKAQNKLFSEKNQIYVMRINTFEESEQNLKQKISDLNHKYEYVKGKYQELSKKYRLLDEQNQAYQQSKKENDKPPQIESRLFTNPGNDESPSNFRSVNQASNPDKQQLQNQSKPNNFKRIHSIDLSSQNGSVQDIDKFAFQVLKQQQNHSSQNIQPATKSGSQLSNNDLNSQQKSNKQISSQQQMNSSSKLNPQDNNSSLKNQSLSPRSHSQIDNINATGGGIQQLKNNYINQMQSTATTGNSSTPMRNSTSVPALFRAPKGEGQANQIISETKASPMNFSKKNNENPLQSSSNQKSLSDIKQQHQKSLLFPANPSSQNPYEDSKYSALVNKYATNIQGQENNQNDSSGQKISEANYISNTSSVYTKPPIMKKSDIGGYQTTSNQYDLQIKQSEQLPSGQGRINSHRATLESVTPQHGNSHHLSSYDGFSQSVKNAHPTLQHVSGYPQSNQSTLISGDQSYMTNSQGYSSQQQQYMSQSSKYANQQIPNNQSLTSSVGHNSNNKNTHPSHSSLASFNPTNPSSYDPNYSESNYSTNQNYTTNQTSQVGNKEMYSSINSRSYINKPNINQNDNHMYSTNPLPASSNSNTSTNTTAQNQNPIQISSFNKSVGQNNSAQKPQSAHAIKVLSVTDFGQTGHHIPKYLPGDYDSINPHSETKIDSEVHTPQKPNIFQSKSVFGNNQFNIMPHTTTNVNQSSVMKENDFAEHLINNEGIQVKKRSQVLHASRRDPNSVNQPSPTSPRRQFPSQYEDKQLMKALFGIDNQSSNKEVGGIQGIQKALTPNQDKMFEISQRVENEFDSTMSNQDRVIPSINPGFASSHHNYSLANSNNNSYNQQQIEKRSLSIKNITPNQQVGDSESLMNLDSTSDNRQKLRTSERNNNNLKTIQIQPFGQGSGSLGQANNRPLKMVKLIENFIVISANQEKTRQLSKQNVFNVDEEIIFKATEPKSDMENEQLKVISKFCFPQGAEVHKYKRDNFNQDIMKMINTHRELQSKEYFVFPIKSAESFEKKNNNQQQQDPEGIDEITNPNKFLYCVCIIARDYIDPTGSQQRMFKSENNQMPPQHYYQVSSVYCIITKYPFFNFYFDLMLSFINKMNVSKKNFLMESQSKNMFNQDYQQIDLSSFKKHINQGVLKVIQSCVKGEIGIDFNTVHKFSLGQELVQLSIPQKESCYLLEAKWGVMQTLTVMNVYEFLYILFSFLLEESLVFLSKNPSTLSQTMMMFLSALKPFKWPHPFVMFLTNDLMHMFDSPFPLVIGINKSYDFIKENKLYKTHSHCIFVNLDEFGISEKKESIYQSSTYTTLTQRIKPDYDQLKQIFNKKDAYNDYSQQLSEISCNIFDKIRKFFVETLNRLLPQKPILDAKNNLDYDQMKNIILKNSVSGDQFIEKFVQSQVLCYYLEEYYNL